MSASAQFHRRIFHGYHPHHVAVLFSKEGHSPHGLGFVNGHFLVHHGNTPEDHVVDLIFHLLQLLVGQSREVGEVEPDGLGVH